MKKKFSTKDIDRKYFIKFHKIIDYFIILQALMRFSLIIPILLYLLARIVVPYNKGVCRQTRWALSINKFFFDRMCLCIRKDMTLNRTATAQKMARIAARFAAGRMVGYYSSVDVERPFLSLAKSLPLSSYPVSPKGTVHVMTKGYLSGGHTQVVRRWIELLSGEPHYIVLTAQGSEPFPPNLESLVNASGGGLVRLDENTPDEKAGLALRTLALQAKRVVLHTHMHDPLPIVAFGVENFPRPVFLMNHADHKFWIGRSVVDLVLEMREAGRSITLLHRGTPETSVVSLPLSSEPKLNRMSTNRVAARRALKIPSYINVFLTIAPAYKFTPVQPYDIRELVSGCLDSCPNSMYFIGGTLVEDPFWVKLTTRYPRRFHLLGPLSRYELAQSLLAADVYIDSIPLGGGLTCLDAAQCGLPVLAHSIYNQAASFIRESGCEFSTTEELIAYAATLSVSDMAQKETAFRQKKMIEMLHGQENWAARVRESISKYKTHNVTHSWSCSPILGDYQVFSNCLER